MRKSRREKADEQRHSFDARANKHYAWINWFEINTPWSQAGYKLPEEYKEFFTSFQAIVQEAINSIDIDAKENAGILDALIDSEAHLAIRKLNLMRVSHLHSLMEIATTKKAHLFQLNEVISLVECESARLSDELKKEEENK